MKIFLKSKLKKNEINKKKENNLFNLFNIIFIMKKYLNMSEQYNI